MHKWYETSGVSHDVVISTRVRLARNLKKYPFSTKLSDAQAVTMVGEVEDGLKDTGDILEGILACNLSEMSEVNQYALVERHIISPQMVQKKQCTGLLMTADESAEIMINEEDHLRIQTIAGGMDAKEAFSRANQIDDIISEQFEYAYDEKYGYLTTCPTNVGTGLRVSYMMFLPALNAAGKITKLVSEIGKYGVALRGIYGEDSQSQASIFQVSNQKTLGSSERELMDNLDNIVNQIIKQERMRREYVFAKNYRQVEDQIYRSYGILKYARKLDSKDAMALLSQVMLGQNTGVLKFKEPKSIYSLIMNIQPYVLQSRLGKSAGSEKREQLRAEYIRSNLPELI